MAIATDGEDLGSRASVDRFTWIKDNWLLIAGITGGVGSLFSFVYLNFYKPAISPVNINVKLDMILDPRVKDDELVVGAKKQAIPVKVSISAENKSDSKSLLLKDPFWVAYGVQLISADEEGNVIRPAEVHRTFNERFALNSKARSIGLRMGQYKFATTMVGAGRIFGSDKIRPKEILQGERIIPVPRDTYDFLQIRIVVPTINDSDEAKKILTQAQVLGYTSKIEAFFCKPVTKGTDCDPLTPQQAEKLDAQTTYTIGEIWLDNDLASLKMRKK
jgi:hypothetical protein